MIINVCTEINELSTIHAEGDGAASLKLKGSCIKRACTHDGSLEYQSIAVDISMRLSADPLSPQFEPSSIWLTGGIGIILEGPK